MPEYLAPGVYVEETSFRAKPIEGVSTSTAAFLGLTRKGPAPVDPEDGVNELANLPELLTNLGEFERIYGGPAPLSFGSQTATNHLAHAVRAFFENGGSRLYVTRVSDGTETAASATIENEAEQTIGTFSARFAGSAGNGSILVQEAALEATWATLERAEEGTFARVQLGVSLDDLPAEIYGAEVPEAETYDLTGANVLDIEIEGSPYTLTFATGPSEIRFTPNLTDLSAHSFTLSINGEAQDPVTLADYTAGDASDVAQTLNAGLVGVQVTVDGLEVVISSDVQGEGIILEGSGPGAIVNPPEGAPVTITQVGNVGDIAAVTTAEIIAAAENHPTLPAVIDVADDGRLRITTDATGATATITVLDSDPNTAHGQLGFTPDEAETGEAGAEWVIVRKTGDTWDDAGEVTRIDAFGELDSLSEAPHDGVEILSMYVTTTDADGQVRTFEDLAYDPDHSRFIGTLMATVPDRRIDQLEQLYAFEAVDEVDPFDLRVALLGGADSDNTTHALAGGDDGGEPSASDYDHAFSALRRLEDVSIVAAPGSSSYAYRQSIANSLVTHCEQRRAYRIAVLDTDADQTPSSVRLYRSVFDSTYGAMYYPWVVIPNPLASNSDPSIPSELTVPPSGFVAGIYARNDVQRGVHKAPANEVVRGAVRFETQVNFAQQETLNPQGINCLRALSGRGLRLWGARTISSDGEWKYVNVRRYFNYLGASIDRGTQWAVFEPNGEALWANIRESVSDFLYNEWRNGALLGSTTKQAYFVRCDRSTMTQNDLDNGRLICEVGVALVKPAEFVIFRIGQKTADARS